MNAWEIAQINTYNRLIRRMAKNIYPKSIKKSIDYSVIMDESKLDLYSIYQPTRNVGTKVTILNCPISKFFNNFNSTKLLVVNSSSYTEPEDNINKIYPGVYQDTFLYDVLSSFVNTYYKENRNSINRQIYTNRSLYTPNIIFGEESNIIKADVLTCSPPKKTNRIKESDNAFALDDRISFLLESAKYFKLSRYRNGFMNLIIDDFGALNFNQSPKDIATMFKYHLFVEKIIDNCFDMVIFTIEDESVYKEFYDTWTNQA